MGQDKKLEPNAKPIPDADKGIEPQVDPGTFEKPNVNQRPGTAKDSPQALPNLEPDPEKP